MLLLVTAAASGCRKLSYKPEPETIRFSGLESILVTKEGALVLSWDPVPADSAPVTRFEIFLQEIPPEAFTEGSFGLQNPTDALTTGVATVEMPDENSPASLGQLIGTVTNGTTYTLQPITGGNYAFQVKAIGETGKRDLNTKVILFKLAPGTIFSGIKTIELSEQTFVLKWDPFVTKIQGEPIHYYIYEGRTFSDNEKIAIVEADKAFYEVSFASKIPGSKWSYGVRVKDPLGKVDNNIVLLEATVPEDSYTFPGCISGTPKGSTHIALTYEFPVVADEVKVLRNGKLVYTANQNVVTQADRDSGIKAKSLVFDDREGLQEGVSYTYRCEMIRLGTTIVGKNEVRVTTLNSNPPTFAGIVSATSTADGSIAVNWGVETGVPAQYYAIYASVGPSVDWAADPIVTAEAGNLTAVVADLGDELPYAIGVRACTAQDICDTNTRSMNVQIGDRGPPKSVGVTDAVITNGKFKLTVPWKHTDGGVIKRRVYVKVGSGDTSDISKYVVKKTAPVNDIVAPDQEIIVDNIEENKIYNFVVRDEDPSGQISTNMNVVSRDSGDLSAPAFTGLTSLNLGLDGEKETTLIVGFNAIAAQAIDPTGASHYMVYLKTGGGNACSGGSLHAEFPSAAYTKGQNYEFKIEKLLPRTMYGVCLKARDQAGNISVTDSFLAKSTIDTTPPVFDGVQTFLYNGSTGKLEVGWNPATSSDTLEYKIQLWKNLVALPEEWEIQNLTKAHPTFREGFTFGEDIFDFGTNDKVFILVNACDNGQFIPNGQKNCTKFNASSALSVQLADIQAPKFFSGIAAEDDQLTPSEGTIIVTWIAPPDWTDYAGFRIYTVDPNFNLTFVKQCACTANNCPEQMTSCELSGLDPFRTYNLHVRAYDQANNITILDPLNKSTAKRTTDTTPPVFSSNLSLMYAGGSTKLSWNPATDNQYANEPAAKLEYIVYRKSATSFANALAPDADGLELQVVENTTILDNADYVSGEYYYYSVCARDASGNRTCDGNVKNLQTPDLVPPTIASFTTDKTTEAKTWKLSWNVTDNVAGPILIRVHRTISMMPNGPVSEFDPVIVAANDIAEVTNLSGPRNEDRYINYLLTAEDSAGNRASATLSILSTNKIELTTVKSSEGPTTGGKLLVLRGVGFHPSTIIRIGGAAGSACVSTDIVSDTIAICYTPPGSVGITDVYVTNSDGSSHTLEDSYTYCVQGSCANICNNPLTWGTSYAAGSGTGLNPWIICTPQHFNSIRNTGNVRRFLKLGDNIDFSPYVANDFPPLEQDAGADNWFVSDVDGDGYALANYSFEAPPGSSEIGFFAEVRDIGEIKNLGAVNFNIKGRHSVGALIGHCASSSRTLRNIWVAGTVTGDGSNIGGVVGDSRCPMIDIFGRVNVSSTASQSDWGRNVGGLAGYKSSSAASLTFTGTVTSPGTVPGSDRCNVGGLFGAWDGPGQDLENPRVYNATVACTAAASVTRHYTGGLFGHVSYVNIKNPYFSGTVTGNENTGGIAGQILGNTADPYNASVENPTVVGTVTSNRGSVGSMLGRLDYARLVNAHYAGTIVSAQGSAGGLVGNASRAESLILNSSFNGTVSSIGADNIGGIAGLLCGRIVDSFSLGSVIGRSNLGGLIGTTCNSVTQIENSYSRAIVSGTGSNIGGLLGYSDRNDIIINSYATGNVTGNTNVGGLAGRYRPSATGGITESYATGNVAGTSNIGGFIGVMYYSQQEFPEAVNISKSYATGDVEASNENIGGFIGYMENHPWETRWLVIEDSYASGKVSSQGNHIGGFLGRAYYWGIKIRRSYALGDVSSIGQHVGGFLGYGWDLRHSRIEDSYAHGDVTGGGNIGGFAGSTCDMLQRVYADGKVLRAVQGVGQQGGLIGAWRINTGQGGLGTLPLSFWNKDSSSLATSYGGASGLTDSEMHVQSSFASWDFTTIWDMPANQPPRLKWQSGY